jgi:hypothetical protein
MGAIENLDQLHQASLAAVQLPLLTRERFADLVGLTHATVFSMCDRGYLPTLHLGGRRVFVNMEALRAMCADKVLS